jgi:glycosyltransferase involved in cell wall biosynthesis
MAGVPVVVHTIHGFPFHAYSSRLEKFIYTKCERWAGRFCDLAISVNHEDRKTALEKNILPPEKVVTVINGVDTGRFETPFDRQAFRQSLGVKDGEVLVGCIARMAEQKDPKTFIDAARLLIRERANVRCLYLGDGPLLEEMKAYAASMGLGDRLLIPGFKRNVEDYLRSLDIFVLNSLWEGLPYALIEAMCVRLPIVTTNIRGNRECVDESCAILVQPQAPEEIQRAVLKFIDEPAFAAELADRAHQAFQEKFTEEQMVDNTFALYEQLFTKKFQPLRNGVYA